MGEAEGLLREQTLCLAHLAGRSTSPFSDDSACGEHLADIQVALSCRARQIGAGRNRTGVAALDVSSEPSRQLLLQILQTIVAVRREHIVHGDSPLCLDVA